jgi:anti-sigma regulatory factor (Ser/Thr protein kinase)
MRATRTFRLKGHARSAAAVRAALRGLPRALDEATIADASLCATELVSNVARHCEGAARGHPVELQLLVDDDLLRVEVSDPGKGFEVGELSPGDETGGWGLFIVDRIADAWGVDPGTRCRVWFELSTSGTAFRTPAAA